MYSDKTGITAYRLRYLRPRTRVQDPYPCTPDERCRKDRICVETKKGRLHHYSLHRVSALRSAGVRHVIESMVDTITRFPY
jgi:hypothetical protein